MSAEKKQYDFSDFDSPAEAGVAPAREFDFSDFDAPPIKPKMGAGDAFIHGAAQGALLGWTDEAQAALGAGWDVLQAALGNRGDIDFGKAYGTHLKPQRALLAQAQDEHPVAYLGGNATGALASSAAAAPIKGLGLLMNPSKAASVAGRVGTAAAAGGVSGAGVSSAGPLESPEQLGEFAGDVGKGVLAGGVVQGGAEALSAGVKALPDALKRLAERRAFKAAVGNQQGVYDEAARKGTINQIGRDLLDEDVVTFGSKASQIADRARSAQQKVGGEIGDLIATVDEAVPKSFSGGNVAGKIREYAESIKSPGNRSIYDQLMRQADEFEQLGAMPLAEAQRLKNTYRWDARDPAAMPIGKDATNKVKTFIGEEMDDVVGFFAKEHVDEVAKPAFAEMTGTGGALVPRSRPQSVLREAQAPGELDPAKMGEAYDALKGKYGNLATAAKAAKKLANRQEKNRTFSLTDYLLGGAAGVATANPVKGMAVAATNKAVRERGSAALAVSADKLADALAAAPEAFGKFAPVLKKAAERGSSALSVTHALLMKSEPQYRALFEDPAQ